jgi:hypothetical protein
MPERYPKLAESEEFKTIIGKGYRKDDMYKLIEDNEDLFKFLQVALIEFLDDIYPAQRLVNVDYQNTLKTECQFFK